MFKFKFWTEVGESREETECRKGAIKIIKREANMKRTKDKNEAPRNFVISDILDIFRTLKVLFYDLITVFALY